MSRTWSGSLAGLPLQLAGAAILLLLLVVLATLQYRWLGAVSEAERDRMRTGLRTRASDFTREFDAEITRTFVAFHVDGEALAHDAGTTLAEAYARWRASAPAADLVGAIYLVEQAVEHGERALRRLDADRRVLEPAPWPPEIASALAPERLPPVPSLPAPLPLFLADAVDARIPALFVPVPFVRKVTTGPQFTLVAGIPGTERAVIVVLDREQLRRHLLEPLLAKYFGDPRSSEYLVTVAGSDSPSPILFNSGDLALDSAGADVTSGFFTLRADVMDRLATSGPAGRGSKTERFAITFMRRSHDGRGGDSVQSADSGAWQLRVRHRSGPLDAIVAQSRRRNLAISLGVLGLLGASMVLIVAAAQRQQRLARQQMEFVAAVSHELRTPLAVICSAGENLADGVVGDRAQVKGYGSLIQSEGRRLRDMVERVLEFSGIASAGSPERPDAEVDFTGVIAEAVEAVTPDARERGVTVTVHLNGTSPLISGDAAALRSAVVNLLGNAIKYSPRDTTVDVSLAVDRDSLRLRVADCGLGIDREDLPHIFKPFYRGRRAIDAQVRGTGVGLSVVRHVVDAHRGAIHVDSRPGESTVVTVDLPIHGAGRERLRPHQP
jgi:signal transduction histidine kinase